MEHVKLTLLGVLIYLIRSGINCVSVSKYSDVGSERIFLSQVLHEIENNSGPKITSFEIGRQIEDSIRVGCRGTVINSWRKVNSLFISNVEEDREFSRLTSFAAMFRNSSGTREESLIHLRLFPRYCFTLMFADQGKLCHPGHPGDIGNPGSTGKIGLPGKTGNPGSPGEYGTHGRQGPVGDIGDPGTPGDTGDPGSPGPVGQSGLVGLTGPDGTDANDL